ncbi:Do family serine endopeptidase [Sulfuriflexus sp.]|uniref:Do family serine endopeptidase n=1 Tax=Sulfuriflexus sp. TaxID=2015443 RepID=UPI0028CF2948|nr:Do family serine endopeptidase [Sulfuriflexus sp.]MDT8403510.1 Do family serine endopeptidase [Sulfuriflexus sp.]
MGKSLLFFFQLLTAVLAALIFVLIFKPELLQGPAPVVEITEQAPAPALADEARNRGPVSYADAVERSAAAVVNIYTAKLVTEQRSPLLDDPFFRRFFGDQLPAPRQRLETSLGSGVIMSPNGYILTNNHVIQGADEVRVALANGNTPLATVIGTDPETDLAVLKINYIRLPAITLGKSDALRVGDVVLAIGNPFGVGQTVTLGIVSATGRSQLGINTFENFIQTDAAINPGNSGGALINAHGQLVGINTAIFSKTGGSQGIGFAIPAALARDVMEQIIENGHVVRGWLGVEAQNLGPELAESFNLEAGAGVVIAGVLRRGPAEEAGLRPGDILTHINDAHIDSSFTLLNTIAAHKPGETLVLRILRDGKELELSAKVAERPQSQI